MALKDITGNFAAFGSNQEYKFQPAASTFGLQLVFDTHPSKVVLYQSLDGESGWHLKSITVSGRFGRRTSKVYWVSSISRFSAMLSLSRH